MNKNPITGALAAVGSGKQYRYSSIAVKPSNPLPSSFVLPYLPDILDQGSVQSCVAHSIAETFQAQSSTKGRISVLEVYGRWRKHRGEGMYPETAFDLGRALGTTTYSYAPENLEVPQALTKSQEYYDKDPSQFTFKVDSYYRIDKDEDFNPDYTLAKYALLQFNCPLLALTQRGRHCEICIGWADAGSRNPITHEIVKQDSFIIQNSWGNIPYPRRDEQISHVEELYLVLMSNNKIECPFTDIKGHWAESYIKNAYFAGYINGRTDTTFEPEENIKRGEVAKLLSTLLTTYDEKFSKVNERLIALEN